MKYKNKEKMNGGHKNETFKIENEKGYFFMKVKKYDNFNHKINYSNVAEFNFVPNLITEDKEKLIWEFVESDKLKLTDSNLKQMAQILFELHNSDLELPESNHKARVQEYFNVLKDKEKTPKEVDSFYQTVLDILEGFDNDTPLHNDPWINNFIDANGKVYLIDWEYASLGDKHFDLAFAIDGSWMNSEQEDIFLDAYGRDNFLDEKLKKAKILVNYLTLVWMHRYDVLPFSDKEIIANLHKK